MDSNQILPDTNLQASAWLAQHMESSLHSQRPLSYISNGPSSSSSARLQALIHRRDVDLTAVAGNGQVASTVERELRRDAIFTTSGVY